MASNDDFRPPPAFCFEGLNLSQEWKEWRRMFELYIDAKDANGKSDKIKIGMFLSAMGPDAVKRFDQYTWDDPDDKQKYTSVVQRFEDELTEADNEVFKISILDMQMGTGYEF